MPRNRISTHSRANRDTDRLMVLASALSASTSRVEDRYWERKLESVLLRLMRAGHDTALESAFEQLLRNQPAAYEVLLELCETLSESSVIEHEGQRYDVLLVAVPFAAWTRYSIPLGRTRPELLDNIRAHLHGHILAADAKLALAPQLLSVDEMPRSFSATLQWTQRLGTQALGKNTALKFEMSSPEATLNMLADTRYIAGAVVVPEGEPMFRWQETPEAADAAREACLSRWKEQIQPTVAELLPGCGVDILLPDAWYAANREADRHVRTLSIGAAVAWLSSAVDLSPDDLRAVIAGCGETQIDEYRIGFTRRNSNDVIYGCVWPLFGPEDMVQPVESLEGPLDTPDEIANLLKEQGVTDIRRLPGILPPDFCDDCGAPYFPDPTGDMVHVELPDEADMAPTHFH